MKRILFFFAAMCCMMVAKAQEFTDANGIKYNVTSTEDKTVEVIANDYSGNIVIPATVTYNDVPYSVTSIGELAFHNREELTSINLPSGLTSIGNNAFLGCSSLTSINIPDGVTSIETSTFGRCSSLTFVKLPSGLTSIGSSAFYSCSSLTSINLPSGLTSIGGSAFYSCSSLTSINLPSGVTSIGNNTFYGCSSLASINIPNGVTSIGAYAFQDCSGLKTITLPSGLTSIGTLAFSGCSSLTYIILPAGLTQFGKHTFQVCANLKYAIFLGTTPPSYPEQTVATQPTYPFYDSGNNVDGTKIVVPDAVNSYTAAGYTDVYTTSNFIDEIKNIILNDIDKAKEGVTLAQDYADIVAVCLSNIKSTTDIDAILIEKDRALSVIYTQKAKDNAIVSIDGALNGSIVPLAQEDIDVLNEYKSDIASMTDIDLVNEEVVIILSKLKGLAKEYLQSSYISNIVEAYLVRIDCAGSWSEIEISVKETVKAFNDIPQFVIGEKHYFVTPRTGYEIHHSANYYGDISFPDGVVYESNSITIHDGKKEYTRTLPEGVWQCWYEPFDVSVDTEKFDAAEVAGILTNAQGETVVAFNKLENGAVMTHNTIYVIRAKKGHGDLKINCDYQTLFPSTETTLTIQSAYDNYTLTGNYSPVEHGDWYTLDGTGKFSKMSSGSLKPQRFYLTITPRRDAYYPQSQTNAKPFIDMMVLGDDEATGIEEASPKSSPTSTELSTGSGKNFIYNLQGQRVSSIQKGQIYIVNGKKFLAK